MDTINKLQISAVERGYFEERKCFELCVKSLSESVMDESERSCLKQCFAKMGTVEGFFLGKLKQTMEYLVVSDPTLRNNFQQSKKN